MSDQEFDVLDELYFVQSFDEVCTATDLAPDVLREVLQKLLEKGWIRCMESRQDEGVESDLSFRENYRNSFYLATKEGLMAHNSR